MFEEGFEGGDRPQRQDDESRPGEQANRAAMVAMHEVVSKPGAILGKREGQYQAERGSGGLGWGSLWGSQHEALGSFVGMRDG